ncbi:hypothetical protein EV193_11394 [Herbihabitans rhizosphaerae]|uniref:Uncharacterized protein n=1 Tax=Herbihabitans rhizosphaerae TaxID=1872711 RepID=A0A4Q7KE96_9PSEU|nr:hypothetical protein [Herbihabitans rhizosphaerae]RZS32250.1 hypothetical protein EV193_11394 [Herbihabitans rhizosphaerae]
MTGENDGPPSGPGTTPLLWRAGEPWTEEATLVVPALEENLEYDGRGPRRLHVLGKIILLLAIVPALAMVVEDDTGDRPLIGYGFAGAIALCVLAVVVSNAGKRARRRVGYPIPPDLKDLVETMHSAESLLRDFLRDHGRWGLKNNLRKVVNYRHYFLEELERARRAGRDRRWRKCHDQVSKYCALVVEYGAAVVRGLEEGRSAREDT